MKQKSIYHSHLEGQRLIIKHIFTIWLITSCKHLYFFFSVWMKNSKLAYYFLYRLFMKRYH